MNQKETNPFDYSEDNKRYHTLAYANRRRFGGKVQKAALDGGFSCPNRDGTCGIGGCLFCRGGSGYFTNGRLSIQDQLDAEIARIEKKDKSARVIGYFQAGTNTYAPVGVLKSRFEPVLAHPKVCGLSIATRADALPLDVLDYLEELGRRCALTVELGLQTVHDETARKINRGHGFQTFLAGYQALKQRGIRVCVHLICGLPGEGMEEMRASARVLGRLLPDGVKIHLLHVIDGTPLAALYRAGGYTPMTPAQYIDAVICQIEQLPPETVVERLTGDGDKSTLLAPLWSRDKRRILGEIDKALYARNTYQGRLFDGAEPIRFPIARNDGDSYER